MKEVTDDTSLVHILTSIPFQIQVYDVPVLRKTEHVARFVGNLLGTVMAVDFVPGRNQYSYLRVRFGVDIRGALPKSTTLVINAAGKTVKFKYERMFSFCFWCGFLDHVVDDCVDFFEKGQRYEECGYDESLRGILPRPAYAPVPAFRASQVVPHPLLTYVALSRYGGKSSLNGTSGLVAPLGFLPLPQRPQPIQQAPLPSLLVSGSMLNSLGTTLGSVPTLAHPASTLAMAFLQKVSLIRPSGSVDSMVSMGSSLFQSGGQISLDSLGERPM